MAIDSAYKRRNAVSLSAWSLLPVPDGTVGRDDRFMLLQRYALAVIEVATPLKRVFAIAKQVRTWAIG